MTVDLSTEEALALRELLERQLSDLYAEISHTDNPGFRRQLRERRDTLRGVLDKLAVRPVA